MSDKNRPDVSSATRILPGRFGSPENPQPVPSVPRAPSPSPASKVMADTRTSLSHRPPTHVEVSAELSAWNPETNRVRIRISACARREFTFDLHELPSRVRWAVVTNQRFYRVAVNPKAETTAELQATDWRVVEAQRERRAHRNM